jgi:SAM-dependent methyltransferase
MIENSDQLAGEISGEFDLWTGRRDSFTPPVWMLRKWGLGPASYAAYERSNNSKARCLIDHGLGPESKILDVGCGAGGLASALHSFIRPGGSYAGFDISRQCIRFCRKAFRDDSRFTFQLVDARNNSYNPKGTVLASQLRFPYADKSFDYAALFSVFTHMVTDEIRHYLTEVRRVLKEDGKCVATFFVWDLPLSHGGQKTSDIDFRFELDDMIVVDKAAPEKAIAFREGDLLRLFEKAGFRHNWSNYGYWRTRSPMEIRYQDIFLLEKT